MMLKKNKEILKLKEAGNEEERKIMKEKTFQENHGKRSRKKIKEKKIRNCLSIVSLLLSYILKFFSTRAKTLFLFSSSFFLGSWLNTLKKWERKKKNAEFSDIVNKCNINQWIEIRKSNVSLANQNLFSQVNILSLPFQTAVWPIRVFCLSYGINIFVRTEKSDI